MTNKSQRDQMVARIEFPLLEIKLKNYHYDQAGNFDDDIPGITETGDVTAHVGTIDGRHRTLAIEVCTCIGSDDTIGTKDELWRELFVFSIVDARRET